MNLVSERRAAPAALRVSEPGRNCWRVARARRAAVLVDGAAYFGALRAAIEAVLAARGESQPVSRWPRGPADRE